MTTLRLMSHNQWKCDKNQPAWEAQGLDCSAEVRERGFVQVFAETCPDVIGCQEVSGMMADFMIRGLSAQGLHYTLLWGGDTPIVYRQDKLELVDADFALYPDEFPGHEGCFNNSHTKSWNVAVFRVKESGKMLIFMTTHLWWKSSNPAAKNYQPFSDEARAYQMSIAIGRLDQLQKQYNCPAVIVGDLNANYASQAVQYALSQGFVHAHDTAVEFKDETNGHHPCSPSGYGPYRTEASFKDAIDHILVRGADEGFVRRFERYSPEYYLPLSDHSPVFIDVAL